MHNTFWTSWKKQIENGYWKTKVKVTDWIQEIQNNWLYFSIQYIGEWWTLWVLKGSKIQRRDMTEWRKNLLGTTSNSQRHWTKSHGRLERTLEKSYNLLILTMLLWHLLLIPIPKKVYCVRWTFGLSWYRWSYILILKILCNIENSQRQVCPCTIRTSFRRLGLSSTNENQTNHGLRRKGVSFICFQISPRCRMQFCSGSFVLLNVEESQRSHTRLYIQKESKKHRKHRKFRLGRTCKDHLSQLLLKAVSLSKSE